MRSGTSGLLKIAFCVEVMKSSMEASMEAMEAMEASVDAFVEAMAAVEAFIEASLKAFMKDPEALPLPRKLSWKLWKRWKR